MGPVVMKLLGPVIDMLRTLPPVEVQLTVNVSMDVDTTLILIDTDVTER